MDEAEALALEYDRMLDQVAEYLREHQHEIAQFYQRDPSTWTPDELHIAQIALATVYSLFCVGRL